MFSLFSGSLRHVTLGCWCCACVKHSSSKWETADGAHWNISTCLCWLVKSTDKRTCNVVACVMFNKFRIRAFVNLTQFTSSAFHIPPSSFTKELKEPSSVEEPASDSEEAEQAQESHRLFADSSWSLVLTLRVCQSYTCEYLFLRATCSLAAASK